MQSRSRNIAPIHTRRLLLRQLAVCRRVGRRRKMAWVPSCSYSANTLCALVRNDATHFGIPTNAPQFQMSIYNIFEFLNFIYLSIFCIY